MPERSGAKRWEGRTKAGLSTRPQVREERQDLCEPCESIPFLAFVFLRHPHRRHLSPAGRKEETKDWCSRWWRTEGLNRGWLIDVDGQERRLLTVETRTFLARAWILVSVFSLRSSSLRSVNALKWGPPTSGLRLGSQKKGKGRRTRRRSPLRFGPLPSLLLRSG